MKNNRIEKLRAAIAPYRDQLVNHPVYSTIKSLQDVQQFMEHHVFAVWDFMSLLKALQRDLTCVDIPWMPRGSANTRYLINEIVTGEESDVDQLGRRISHFELYREAMQQAGCDLRNMDTFTSAVQSGATVSSALKTAAAPEGAARFVENTFRVINTGKLHVIAGVFTFGREDLIPDMFLQLIRELKQQFPDKLDVLQYYIERHIEVDGGHHGELALQMTEELCGEDDAKWQECETEVIAALKSRALLWDSIYTAVCQPQQI
jgi:hypothetical protein